MNIEPTPDSGGGTLSSDEQFTWRLYAVLFSLGVLNLLFLLGNPFCYKYYTTGCNTTSLAACNENKTHFLTSSNHITSEESDSWPAASLCSVMSTLKEAERVLRCVTIPCAWTAEVQGDQRSKKEKKIFCNISSLYIFFLSDNKNPICVRRWAVEENLQSPLTLSLPPFDRVCYFHKPPSALLSEQRTLTVAKRPLVSFRSQSGYLTCFEIRKHNICLKKQSVRAL